MPPKKDNVKTNPKLLLVNSILLVRLQSQVLTSNTVMLIEVKFSNNNRVKQQTLDDDGKTGTKVTRVAGRFIIIIIIIIFAPNMFKTATYLTIQHELDSNTAIEMRLALTVHST